MSLLVRDFSPEDGEAFARLNLQWIEAFFAIEDTDNKQLRHPQEAIIDPGGAIAIAELDGEVVGCGALVPPHYSPSDGKIWIELAKFATAPFAQGKGVGSAVMDYLVEVARKRGCSAIWLETNDRLDAATRLYRTRGFRELEGNERWPSPYSRCNLQMALDI